ncbi:MAG: polyprenyl synthetase family protein [Lachnospiraceae bacterium]|nr:polyprenyl synthetase family protein [Lachnospiraceae bacterium]
MSNRKEELQNHIKEVEGILAEFLTEQKGVYYERVIDAMRYSFFAGGKRLRPMMMLESYRMFCGKDESIVKPYMAALEMIHTYSLIHDDLPAMDNDDYRRGRLTNHKQYDEATAILAGDGLLNMAFETVSDAMMKSVSAGDCDLLKKQTRAFQVLGHKAGVFGMIGGQVADIEGEKKTGATKEELLFIHENKTAALIQAALTIGAILAGASDEEISKMEKTGYNVGVAFQIQDDILDCIGDESLLGKPVGSDAKNEKTTYVSLEGLEKAQADQKQLSEEAIAMLDEITSEQVFLKEMIKSLVNRDK